MDHMPAQTVSRVVPQTEKVSVCALYGAQGYRQVLALKFRVGDFVRLKEDLSEIREITSFQAWEGRVVYALDGSYHHIWQDDELCLAPRFAVGDFIRLNDVTHKYRVEEFEGFTERGGRYKVRKLPDAPLPMIVWEDDMRLAEDEST